MTDIKGLLLSMCVGAMLWAGTMLLLWAIFKGLSA